MTGHVSADPSPDVAAAAMMAKVGGEVGTLRYPHLIQPYLARYSQLPVYCGGPWRPHIV